MHMFKFILFVGLFLVCGLVSAATNTSIETFDNGYQVRRIDISNDMEQKENTPLLNCSVHSLDYYSPDSSYEIHWDVKAYKASSKKIMAMVQKTENADLIKKTKANFAEINDTVASSGDYSELLYDFQGSSLLSCAKRSTLVFDNWPDKKDQLHYYIINYKIFEVDTNKGRKTNIAHFTLNICCYWLPVDRIPMVLISNKEKDDNGESGKYDSDVLKDIKFIPEQNGPINFLRIVIAKK